MISNTKETINRLSGIISRMKLIGFPSSSDIMSDLIVEFVDCVDNHVGDDDIVLMHICKPAESIGTLKEDPFGTNKESDKLLDNDLFRDSIENLLIKCSDSVFENNALQESVSYIIKRSDRNSSIVQTCLERSTPGGCFRALNEMGRQDAIRIASIKSNYRLLSGKIGSEVLLEMMCDYIKTVTISVDITYRLRNPESHNDISVGDDLFEYCAQIICNNRDTSLHDMVFERIRDKRKTLARLSIFLMEDMIESGDFERWAKYIHKNPAEVLRMCSTREAKVFVNYFENKKWSLKVHLNRYFEYLAGQTTIGDNEKHRHGGYLNVVLNTGLASSATKVLSHIGIERVAEWWPDLSDDSFKHLMSSFPECPRRQMVELFPNSKRIVVSSDLGI